MLHDNKKIKKAVQNIVDIGIFIALLTVLYLQKFKA